MLGSGYRTGSLNTRRYKGSFKNLKFKYSIENDEQ